MHLRRPGTPRVQPLDWARDKARERMKNVPANAVNVSGTLANSKVLSRIVGGSAGVVMSASNTDPRLRETVILRMGWNCQSIYEFGQHQMFGRSVGLTDAEIYNITRPISLGQWGPAEAALLQMVDDLYADDCVTDATWAEAAQHFGTADIIHVLTAAGCYRLVSGFLNSAGVQLDDGVPGWPSAPPA